MTARGDYFQQALDFYGIFAMMGWKDCCRTLGAAAKTRRGRWVRPSADMPSVGTSTPQGFDEKLLRPNIADI